MRAWIARLALLSISALFMVAVCEMFVRVAMPQDLGIWRTTRDGMITLRPGLDTRLHSFGHDVRTNSLGFRDDEHAKQRPEGALRVIVLGDSFMEALQVEIADAFPTRLGAELSEQLGRPVDVLNAGVSGWGTADEAVWLSRAGAEYEADLVLVAMTLHNDVSDNMSLRHHEIVQGRPVARPAARAALLPWLALELKGWLAAHSHLYRLVTNRMKGGEIIAAGHALDMHVADLLRRQAPPEIARGFALTTLHLDEIRASAAARGADMAVFMIPLAIQLEPGGVEAFAAEAGLAPDLLTPQGPQDRIREWGARAGVEVIDLLPVMRTAAGGNRDAYYLPLDGHWNEAGHALAARAVAAALLEADHFGRAGDRARRPAAAQR